MIITIDFETYWSADYTLSKMPTEAYVRDSRFKAHMVGVKIDDKRTAVLTDEQFRNNAALHTAIRSNPLLCQNTAFDGLILAHHYGLIPAFYLDTMSMFRAIHPDKRASLKVISETLGLEKKGGASGYDVVNTKGKWTLSLEEWQACAMYCALDCDLAWQAYNLLKPELPLFEYRLIDQTVRFFTQPILRLNPEPLRAEIEAEQKRKADLMTFIEHDRELLTSNPKFAALLESYGVTPPIKVSPTALKKDPSLKDKLSLLGAEQHQKEVYDSLDIPYTYAFGKTDAAMKALQQHDDPMVQAIVAARLGVKSTIAETRATTLLNASARGAFPVQLNYAAAHTLRWGGTGGVNFQNLPRNSRLREAIIPPEGCSLVVCDLSSIEARVLPYLAGQDDVIEVFERGEDLYCDMASAVYQRKITKKDKAERQVGKILILSSGYGMSWQKFATNMYLTNKTIFPPEMLEELGISKGIWSDKVQKSRPLTLTEEQWNVHCAVSEYLSNVYREKNAEIVRFWRRCDTVLNALVCEQQMPVDLKGVTMARDGGLYSPVGGPIRYIGLHAAREGSRTVYTRQTKEGRSYLHGAVVVENLVQHLSRHILAEQALKLQDMGLKIAFTCHDEIVGVCRDEDAEDWKEKMLTVMSTTPPWMPGLPLGAEAGIAKNYNEAK